MSKKGSLTKTIYDLEDMFDVDPSIKPLLISTGRPLETTDPFQGFVLEVEDSKDPNPGNPTQ